MEQGALQDRLQQGEFLLRGGLSSLLQFGLQSLHGLQGKLSVCRESVYIVVSFRSRISPHIVAAAAAAE